MSLPIILEEFDKLTTYLVADYGVKEYRELVIKAYSTALEDVLEVKPKEKDWPLFGRDTSPYEGNTEDEKWENKGFNQALSEWEENINNLK